MQSECTTVRACEQCAAPLAAHSRADRRFCAQPCYAAWRRERADEAHAARTEKPCNRCGVVKPIALFARVRRRDGTYRPRGECAPCRREVILAWERDHPERVLEAGRSWRRAKRDLLIAQRKTPRAQRVRRSRALRDRGLTIEWYEQTLADQGGGCAICGRAATADGKVLAVDHDHESGATRGILCSGCNQGLGRFSDSPALLRRAADYLESA
jgi:hypothetical protein